MSLHQTNLTTAQLRAVDAAHHLHPFSDARSLNAEGARVIVKGKGVYLWDSEGNRILDGMSGLWNVNIGHGRREVIDAVSRQMSELAFYNTFFKTTHLPAIELARVLAEVTPTRLQPRLLHRLGLGIERHHHSHGAALLGLRWATRQVDHHRRRNGYHGSTIGGASLGGMKLDARAGRPADPRHRPYRASPTGMARAASRRRRSSARVRRGSSSARSTKSASARSPPSSPSRSRAPAASSSRPRPIGREIQRICKERDILLISDEVICGFGRTGHWFGCEYLRLSSPIS